MAWTTHRIDHRSKTWKSTDDSRKRIITATLLTLHYSSVVDGEVNSQVDFTPERITAGGYDGWRVTAAPWHYFLGKYPASAIDGWVGFGGRKGQNALWYRLMRVGYLRWSDRTWFDVGGNPDYDRVNLSQAVHTTDIGPETAKETIAVSLHASWNNIWVAPGGGALSVQWQAFGDRLKELIYINQAGRDYIETQYPGGLQTDHYFAFVFQLDVSDIPKWIKNDIQQDIDGDFDDDDGTSAIEIRDGLDRLLGLLPISDCWVEDADGEEIEDSRLHLRKRIYSNGGNYYLAVGARVDQLNGLPSGTLVFDPTIDVQIGASAKDASERGNQTPSVTGNTVFMSSSFVADFVYAAGWIWSLSGIASGDTVDVAYAEMYFTTDSADSPNGTFFCEDVDDSSDFTTTDGNVENRTRTTESVSWINLAGYDAGWQQSPSLTGPVQEVIDRGGWAAGNSICLLWQANGDQTSNCAARAYDNIPAEAAKLHIEYTAATGNPWYAYAQQG